MTSSTSGLSATSLTAPLNTSVGDGKVVVVDSDNHRILIWSSIPTVNGQAADLVYGQPDFTSNVPNIGSFGIGSVRGPVSAFYRNGILSIGSFGNARIVVRKWPN
jgi:hypothetical protein